MHKRLLLFVIACVTILPLIFSSSCHGRPPKPGPDFMWVKAHPGPDGISMPGHWKYVGPPVEGKVWVPAHRDPRGSGYQVTGNPSIPSKKKKCGFLVIADQRGVGFQGTGSKHPRRGEQILDRYFRVGQSWRELELGSMGRQIPYFYYEIAPMLSTSNVIR